MKHLKHGVSLVGVLAALAAASFGGSLQLVSSASPRVTSTTTHSAEGRRRSVGARPPLVEGST